MSVRIDTRPSSDPGHWAQVHLQGDLGPLFQRAGEIEYPFWIPEWTVRRLLAQRERVAMH